MTILEANDNLTSLISTAIDAVLKSVSKASDHGITLTEAMTETIVVDPLLAALGYAVWEYQKQGQAEGVGNFPDYTMLPKTPHQWFLEVKKWKLPLTEKDINQTVGYAFSQGTRWAVLTNGNEWRIYDAYSQAPLLQKCILSISSIDSADSPGFFHLLMKEAMQQDQLAASYRARLILQAIQLEFANQESATIKAIRKIIESPNVLNLTKKEVYEALQRLWWTPFVDSEPSRFLGGFRSATVHG